MNIFICYSFIFSLIGCTQSTGTRLSSNQSEQLNTDSLKQLVRTEFKLVDIKLIKDTLFIVSTNKSLYYPFGAYSNFNEFYHKHSNESDICKTDSIHNVFKVISIQRGNSKIEFIENTETNRLELLSANINDSSFRFLDGIKVGIGKTDMLLKIFTHVPQELKEIRVIKMESGLEGIWYFYIFSQEVLKKIIIETDYDLNK